MFCDVISINFPYNITKDTKNCLPPGMFVIIIVLKQKNSPEIRDLGIWQSTSCWFVPHTSVWLMIDSDGDACCRRCDHSAAKMCILNIQTIYCRRSRFSSWLTSVVQNKTRGHTFMGHHFHLKFAEICTYASSSILELPKSTTNMIIYLTNVIFGGLTLRNVFLWNSWMDFLWN